MLWEYYLLSGLYLIQCIALKLYVLTGECKYACVNTQNNACSTENEYYVRCDNISSH